MPELPEVETTRRGIAPHIEGRVLQQMVIRQPSLRWPIPDEIQRAVGETLVSVLRRGKYLLFQYQSGTMLSHLGMSGSLRIVEDEPPRAHDHVDLLFADGVTVRYCDPRRFGAWLWTERPVEEHSLLSHLGPEPLSDAFSVDYLVGKAAKRQTPVKTLIMNSQVVVGVGNIYANEALYRAGIDPRRPAGKIRRMRYERLHGAIREVLAQAIEVGGTTLRDFVGGDGAPGYFRQSLDVYGRGGKPCRQCARPLTEIRLGQRTTVFCKVCQT